MKLPLVLLGASFLFSTPALASADLAKARNCLVCHSSDKKIVGPSYKDIAAKRAGQKDADAALALKIKGGSKSEWGPVPMPPNKVSDAEALTLAQWVLSHK